MLIVAGIAQTGGMAARSIISQARVSVLDNGLIADANAFLSPFEAVFQFFEDGSTVKIAFLLGLGLEHRAQAGKLIKILCICSVAIGVVASIIASLVSLIPSAVQFFVPFKQSATMPLNCPAFPFLSHPAALASLVRPYWILRAWSWPGAFLWNVAQGTLLGTNQFTTYAMLSIILCVIQAGLSFLLQADLPPDSTHNLVIMGLITFISNSVIGLVFLWVFFRTDHNRRMFHLDQPLFEPDEFQKETSLWRKTKALLSFDSAGTDGLNLMIRDLCDSVVSSVKTMVFGRWSIAVQFKVQNVNVEEGVSEHCAFVFSCSWWTTLTHC